MADINLKNTLQLRGDLTFTGGKLLVGSVEVLVETVAPTDPAQGHAPSPVVIPPPPGAPSDPGVNVWVLNSFNKTIKAGTRAVVAQGLVMQGNAPSWPGLVMPGSAQVTINGIPINVVGDRATIFPSGVPVTFDASGQG